MEKNIISRKLVQIFEKKIENRGTTVYLENTASKREGILLWNYFVRKNQSFFIDFLNIPFEATVYKYQLTLSDGREAFFYSFRELDLPEKTDSILGEIK